MTKVRGCGQCEHNPMGVCDLTGKEVPVSYVTRRNNGVPKFCPFKGELE